MGAVPGGKTGGGPLVTVVVLSFGRPSELRLALHSVASQTFQHLEVIVVDNRSSASDAIASLVAEFPAFKLIACAENRGFTGGMNRGLEEASGEYVYLTEDDMVLQRDCIETLLGAARGYSGTFVLAPAMIDQQRGKVRCAGGGVLLDGVYRQRDFDEGDDPTCLSPEPYPVSYIPGSMMWASAETWRRLGGFSQELFIYYEDVDLCLRVVLDGGQLLIVPSARVANLDPPGGTTIGPGLAYHKVKNFFRIYFVYARAGVLPEFVFRYVVLGIVRAVRSGELTPLLRGLAWTVAKIPSLLRERGAHSAARRRWLSERLVHLFSPPGTRSGGVE